jgi:fumarate reductase subunit C
MTEKETAIDTTIKDPSVTPGDKAFTISADSGYTLTYSESAEGWVSFYSYYPDWMIGMNNYFYTFKGGNLYRHNTNPIRNTFYQDWWTATGNPSGSFTNTSLVGVFNDRVLENKLFKTITLQGDSIWSATLESELQYSGYIDATWFEKKEATYFAYVRNTGTVPAAISEYALRSLNGIGRSVNASVGITTDVDFSISPLIVIDSIISIGDYVYFAVPPYTTPQFAGTVSNVIRNYPGGVNRLIIDTTIAGAVPVPIPDAYFLYIKNSLAESHGILGHYCVFNINNDSTSKIELFAVESEIMKSFP